MKKTFYTGPLMMFYAAPFFILMFLAMCSFSFFMINDLISKPKMDIVFILCTLFVIILTILAGYILYYYSPKLFATLTFKNGMVCWRCIFHRTRKLALSDCRIGVQLEESAFGAGYPHIFFTTKPYPYKYYNKINRVKCSATFVKFWYREKIVEYLVENLPREQVSELKSFKARQAQMRRKKK